MPRSQMYAVLVSMISASALGSAVANAQAQKLGVTEPGRTQQASQQVAPAMKIRISIDGGRSVTVTLVDTATARDFATLLPLTVTLKDYASTEKISDLPRRLSTEDAPEGFEPSTGDITYYAPWGNLAIFYKDFRYSTGLIGLGKLDGDLDLLNSSGPITAMIERE
jgi:hypothetical protein